MTATFEKESLHQGGSIPFWDMRWSARLMVTKGERKVFLDSFDLLELKQLLKDFDGRKGVWK